MFGKRKREREEEHREMLAHLEAHKELVQRCERLEGKVNELIKKLEELQKRTISQRTLGENEAPASWGQIMDEWFNGEESGTKEEKKG